MQDFKSRHKSNWPKPDQHPSLLECIGGGVLIAAAMMALMYLALIQATGGL